MTRLGNAVSDPWISRPGERERGGEKERKRERERESAHAHSLVCTQTDRQAETKRQTYRDRHTQKDRDREGDLTTRPWRRTTRKDQKAESCSHFSLQIPVCCQQMV